MDFILTSSLALIVLFWVLGGRKKPIVFLRFSSVLLLILIGLRHDFCFMDSLSYVEDYHQTHNLSFYRIPAFFSKDILYWYVVKIFNIIFFDDATAFKLVNAFVFIFLYYKVISKYSKDYFLSILLYFTLGFFIFCLCGARQTYSLALCLYSLNYILDKKFLKFLICVLLAALFHSSAIVFLIAWPLSRVKLKKMTFLIYLAVFVVINIFGAIFYMEIVQFCIDYVDEARFAHYLTDDRQMSYSGLIQQGILFIISLTLLRRNIKEPFVSLLLQIAIIGIFFQLYSAFIAEFFRVSMYFSIFYTILLPYALYRSKLKVKKLLHLFICMLLVAYCVASQNLGFHYDYHFFFENLPNSEFVKINAFAIRD